jgi:hypothetical protein
LDILRFIHIHQIESTSAALDVKSIAKEVAKVFPICSIDIKPPFEYDDRTIEQARITDAKHPFEKQPKQQQHDSLMIPLYDGFVLQRLFADMITSAEISISHIHIIFTSLLTCTFNDDEDWRYHGRAIICGMPSIISTTGIIEALAKPKEFYISQLGRMVIEDNSATKKKFAGKFIDYGDTRITAAGINYALQAIFFFLTGGDPFCSNKDCRLYNAHWQEDLIHTIEKGMLCNHHRDLASNFVKK